VEGFENRFEVSFGKNEKKRKKEKEKKKKERKGAEYLLSRCETRTVQKTNAFNA